MAAMTLADLRSTIGIPTDLTARAEALAQEIERHDGAMTHAPWSTPAPPRFQGSVGATMSDGIIRQVAMACGQAPQFDDEDVQVALRDNASGIACLRNAAPEVAATLRALVAEVERLDNERADAVARAADVPGLSASLDEARWELDVVLKRDPASGQALQEIARLIAAREADALETATNYAAALAEIDALRCGDLVPFQDGELSQARADAFREHLGSCAACRTGLEELLKLDARLAHFPGPTRR